MRKDQVTLGLSYLSIRDHLCIDILSIIFVNLSQTKEFTVMKNYMNMHAGNIKNK